MSPNLALKALPRMRPQMRLKMNGTGLVAAIALIIVVALMAMGIARTVQLGAGSVSLDILSQRALLAATTGAQIGLNRVFAPVGAASCVNRNLDVSSLGGLPACQAAVSCSSDLVRGKNYYTVTSTGLCTADSLQAERSVVVLATP
jgi:MSHA biogenesis protein MshP